MDNVILPGDTSADIRADLARYRLARYQVAAVARMNPAALSTALNDDQQPLPAETAKKIRAAIAALLAGEARVRRR